MACVCGVEHLCQDVRSSIDEEFSSSYSGYSSHSSYCSNWDNLGNWSNRGNWGNQVTGVTGVTGVTCEQVGVVVYQVRTRCDQLSPVGNFLTII